MGDNVGDYDGTSRTPLISLAAPPCPTLPYSVLSCFVCLLEFNFRGGNAKFEFFQRDMRGDQPETLEPMGSTLTNTDQQRTPH